MSERKFYWLKLDRQFFKRHDIRIVESMPNGKDYILFYLKLLCESISHNGELRFSEAIPYNETMLSVVTDTNVDVVRAALQVFSDLNMIEILDDGTLYMTESQKMLGSETGAAQRMREMRSRNNVTPALQERYTEKEIDKDIEIDKEKDKKKRFVPPKVDEVRAYCEERGNGVDPEAFVDFYTAKGWKVGSNPMKDWQAAVRNWERTDDRRKPQAGKPSKPGKTIQPVVIQDDETARLIRLTREMQ